MKKEVKYIVIAVIIVIVLPLAYLHLYNRTPSPEGFVLNNVSVTQNNIIVDSMIGSAALFQFREYSAEYNDNKLYVEFKGAWRLPFEKKTTNTVYFPILNEYPDLRELYLVDGDKSRLIWTKEGGIYRGE